MADPNSTRNPVALEQSEKCTECQGTGKVFCQYPHYSGMVTCVQCHGSGRYTPLPEHLRSKQSFSVPGGHHGID